MEPVTEQSNELTKNIDVATAAEMVQLLWEADKQMFSETTGLLSHRTIQTIEKIAAVATQLLETGDSNLIVLSGCGTSGRIAFQTYRLFSRLFQKIGKSNCIDYLISGSNKALFEPRESVEDNPHIGRNDLEAVTSGKMRVLYIGITCGLSAAYVAGQLEFCTEHLDTFVPVLLGFNPVDAARNVSVESWDKTCLQVARHLETLQAEDKAFILNPVIGPEPITGSTRMKGGSATKILLNIILMTSLAQCQHFSLSITDQLRSYIDADSAAYSDVTQLGRIVQLAGHSLSSGGHIYYVAACESLGLCGLIDASECKPTYGASVEDVRAFVVGGYESLVNGDADLSSQVNLQISSEYFESDIVPRLSSNDLVLVLSTDGDVWLSEATLQSSAVKVLIDFVTSTRDINQNADLRDAVSVVHTVRLPRDPVTSLAPVDDAMMTSMVEVACKLTCNVVTTCGYVLYGKVYKNYMIDLAASNNKLFHRALSIIQKFGECSETDATSALLKCIYETDCLSETVRSASISQHTRVAVNKRQVVPTAILLVKLGTGLDTCRRVLARHPVLRDALARANQLTS